MTNEELTRRIEALNDEYAPFIVKSASYKQPMSSFTNDVKFYLLAYGMRYHELLLQFSNDLFKKSMQGETKDARPE